MNNFKLIDIKAQNLTEEKLKEVLIFNSKQAVLTRNEIKKLKDAAEIVATPKQEEIEPSFEFQEIEIEEETENFEDEVEYYLSELKQLSKEELEKNLEEVLPNKMNYNYKKILFRLQAESLKTIKEIRELLIEEKDNLQEKDYTELSDEIDFEYQKIALINNVLHDDKEEVIESQEENKLIFVPTPSGNIRVIEEIEQIAPEYYPGFIGLFDSIKNGTFKNVKRFTNNREFSGTCEVKDKGIRVLFTRLNKDSYAIISAFVKKCNTNKSYLELVANRVSDYRAKADSLKNNLENEEFLELQSFVEQELYKKLGVKELEDTTKFQK